MQTQLWGASPELCSLPAGAPQGQQEHRRKANSARPGRSQRDVAPTLPNNGAPRNPNRTPLRSSPFAVLCPLSSVLCPLSSVSTACPGKGSGHLAVSRCQLGEADDRSTPPQPTPFRPFSSAKSAPPTVQLRIPARHLLPEPLGLTADSASVDSSLGAVYATRQEQRRSALRSSRAMLLSPVQKNFDAR
jgi:hypothetical protein